MKLKDALLNQMQPGGRNQIWVGEIQPDTNDFRYGDAQFVDGGVSDGRVFLADGDLLNIWYLRCFDEFTQDEIDQIENVAEFFYDYLEDSGYFDDAKDELANRHIFKIHEQELQEEITQWAKKIETDPDVIVDACMIALIENSGKFSDSQKALDDWKIAYPIWHTEIKALAFQHSARAWLSQVVTASEACEIFGLAEATVRQAINRGQLPARKSGGTWIVRRVDVEKRWKVKEISIKPYGTFDRAKLIAEFSDAIIFVAENQLQREINEKGIGHVAKESTNKTELIRARAIIDKQRREALKNA